MCSVYMVGYWQGCRLVIIAFGLILMFMSAADALRRQCSPTALSYFFSESSPPNIAQCQCGWALVHVFKPCHRVFFAMHKVCLTLQLLRSVPSTWFKPPCALESCFFLLSMLFSMPLLRSQEHIYIEILYCICFQTIYLFYTYNCKLVPIRISQLL